MKTAQLPLALEPEKFMCQHEIVEEAVWKDKELVNHRKVRGSVLFFVGQDLDTIESIAREVVKCGGLALIAAVEPRMSFQIPVFVFNEDELRDLRESFEAFITLAPIRNDADVEILDGLVMVPTGQPRIKSRTFAEAAASREYKSEPAATSREHKSESSTSSWGGFASKVVSKMTSYVYPPKVKADLQRILTPGCNWFDPESNLKSFYKAVDLLRIAKDSDKVGAEMGEILKQISDHMRECHHQIDIVLLSYAMHFLRSAEILNSKKDRKQFRASIVKCVRELNLDVDSMKLCDIVERGGKKLLHPCEPLLWFASTHLDNFLRQGESSSDKDDLISKLVWIEVHQCGNCFDWRRLVGLVRPISFRGPMPTNHRLQMLLDTDSFQTLALAVQPSVEAICYVVQLLYDESDPGEFRAPIEVDLDDSDIGRWVAIFQRCDDIALCGPVIESLNCLRFKQKNRAWKYLIVSSFVQAHWAGSLMRLQQIWENVDVEHSDRSIFREEVMKILASSLYRREGRYAENRRAEVIQNLLRTPTIGNFLGSNELQSPMQVYLSRVMEGWEDFKVKVDLVESIYNNYVLVGDVGYEDISSLVLESLKRALESTGPWQHMFHIASRKEDVFSTKVDERGLLESIAILVLKNAKLENDYSTLTSLPLSDLGDGNLISCLTGQLTLSLHTSFGDIAKAAILYSDLVSKSSPRLKQIIDTVLLSAIKQWSPITLLDILLLNTKYLETIGGFLASHTDPAIECELAELKLICTEWVCKVKANDVLLSGIERVLDIYDSNKWRAIENITGVKLVHVVYLDDELRKVDDILSSINLNLFLTNQLDGTPGTQSVLDIFRRYVCDIDDGGIANLLRKGLDSSNIADIKNTHTVSSIKGISDALATFREEFDSPIRTAAYFLGVNCTLFYDSIGFGNWTSIPIENFLEKVVSAEEELHSLLKCDGGDAFSAVQRATKLISKDNDEEVSLATDALRKDVSLLVSCPTFVVSEFDQSRFHLLSSLVGISGPLNDFVDCCEQLQFQFIHSDNSFAELVAIANNLNCTEGSRTELEQYGELAGRLVAIVSPSTTDASQEEVGRVIDEMVPCMTVFRSIARCCDVWTFVREMKWFGKDGLQQFYSEFNNVTNQLLFASTESFESTVLDSLEPTVRFLSVVGSLLDEVQLKEFFQCFSSRLNLRVDLNGRRDLKRNLQMVQENITNIREWFDSGIDDMTAIFSRFDLVWQNGKYVIRNRELCLVYSSGEKEECLSGSSLDEFAQQLGFVQHENQDTSTRITSFMDQLQVLRKVVAVKAHTVSIGYLVDGLDSFVYRANEDLTAAAHFLSESNQMLQKCDAWRKELYSKFPLSILFWTDDLRNMYDAIVDLSSSGDTKNLDVIIPGLAVVIPPKILPSVRDEVLAATLRCVDLLKEGSIAGDETWIEVVSKFLEAWHDNLNRVRYSKLPNAGQSGIFLHSFECDDDKKELMTLGVMKQVYQVCQEMYIVSSIFYAIHQILNRCFFPP